MSRRTDGACPIATNIFIRKQAKKEKISLREMIRKYAEESETPYETLQKWVHPRKKSEAKNGLISEPDQKKTKLEIKEHVSQIIEGIERGEISEDDVKNIIDTAAAGIGKKVYPIRVGAEVQPAIKAVRGKGEKKNPKPKPIDNFDRLRKSTNSSIEGLTAWADGNIKPESQDEAACSKSILEDAANHIIQYARLGVDILNIYETFIKEKEGNEVA